MQIKYHIPVMPEKSVTGLNLHEEATVVDATFGGGGHSRVILNMIGKGKLFAFDQDEDAEANLIDDDRLIFIRHNFRYLKNFLRFYNTCRVDAIFADLGVSSHDLDIPSRGFSYRFDNKLDMRMNRNSNTDAAMVINNYSGDDLVFIFHMYGEIKNARRLVSEIIKYRQIRQFRTTGELKKIAVSCAPGRIRNKYLSQVFQALRLEVNDEIEALKELLTASLELLKPGGRIAIITYHSIEDRICKNFFKAGNFQGRIEKDFYGNPISPFRLVNRKVITPSQEELEKNPRARSAKLRIAEKI